jgi:glycerate dehydrogenase
VLDSLPLDADQYLDWSAMAALGTLTLHPQTTPEQVAERIADAAIVLTNKVSLRALELQQAPALRLISVLATGYDVVDVATAREHKITVCNVPGYSTPSTAQTTIALLLELCHRVGEHTRLVQDGEWQRRNTWSWWSTAPRELAGKTLLLIGSGQIGTQVGRIALALGMTVLAAHFPDRPRKDTEFSCLPLGDALPQADVVSLHVPLTPTTDTLVDATFLYHLKPGALLINTARGRLVDEAAVAASLQTGRLGGFAADVLSTEPPSAANPLLTAPHCIITPHFAWASRESRQRLLSASVGNINAFLDGRPQNVVS